MTWQFDTVIVGAGHGGTQAAIVLRQRGVGGTIALVGDEPELPYERPPLSKAYLAGEKEFERLLIRPAGFWAEREIEVLTGTEIVRVDPVAHMIETSGGDCIGYRRLVWSAGGHARRLSCAGSDLGGVHSVRNRADVDRLIAELPRVEKVCIVGGGYIGLEAAAVLAKLGRQVTVLEAQERVLARVSGHALSQFVADEHRRHGVDLRLGVTVECLVGEDGWVTGVRLASGEKIAATMVIVGVGIVPAVAPLLAAGAQGGNGVAVDLQCRTTLADIYAIGDCAIHENAFADGAALRLESVQNANDMAAVVAQSIAGEEQPYRAVPWFWSDQYDLKLQTVGLAIGHDTEIVRGDPASRSFSVVYLKRGRVIALDCVNRVRDYVQGRALVTDRIVADPARLADPDVLLKLIAADERVRQLSSGSNRRADASRLTGHAFQRNDQVDT